MAAHLSNEWQYHQDGRDQAASLGYFGIIAIFVVVLLFVLAVIVNEAVHAEEAQIAEDVRDGSTAGANAVTVDDLESMAFRDEFAEGMYSVTLDDLNRAWPEEGGVYPMNGKNTPLTADTVNCKGAGMVDIVTYDKRSNVQIRHFGQVQEDGSIRWYAAQYVLDENGNVVVAPRG